VRVGHEGCEACCRVGDGAGGFAVGAVEVRRRWARYGIARDADADGTRPWREDDALPR
jgi:hypothetical protein